MITGPQVLDRIAKLHTPVNTGADLSHGVLRPRRVCCCCNVSWPCETYSLAMTFSTEKVPT